MGDYLDRSQMVLIELANASPGAGLDISSEQERAANLLIENRLYRQTALQTGDAVVAGVLEELERVLLEISHAPSRLEPGQVDDLRQPASDRRYFVSNSRPRFHGPEPGRAQTLRLKEKDNDP